MPCVRLWFYDPAGDSEGWINKVVARIDPPFCHVELQFEDKHACSVYMGSAVLFREREFDAPNYTCVLVPCGAEQYARAYSHARRVASSGVLFSSLQMYSCVLWAPLANSERITFCSKLVADILRSADILSQDIEPHTVTPSALHRLAEPLARARAAPVRSVPACPIGFKTR